MALVPLQPNRTIGNISPGIKLIPLNPQRGFLSTAKTTLPITQPFIPTYEKPPETPEETIARKTAFLKSKEGENVVMKSLKWLGSMVISPFTPLIQDVAELSSLNEISKGVANGKYDPKILDEFEVLKKTAPQVVGDVAQSVLMLTPLKALDAIKGLPIISKIALGTLAKVGAQIGGAFGIAGALSEQPEVKPTELVKGAISGAVGGAIAMPILGIAQRGISAGISKALGKPKVAPKIAPKPPEAIKEAIPPEKGIIPQELQKAIAKAKDTKEFGFQGQGLKEITTEIPLEDIPKRSITTPEYRDERVVAIAGRKVTKPIVATVKDITNPNSPIEIVDGWHRWRQAVANKDTTIPVKFIFKPTEALKGIKEVKPEVKPEVPQPTTIEKIFPSLYEKRIIKQGLLDPIDIVKEPPQLSTIQEILKPFSPVRTVLAKDPQASYIGLKLREVSQKQNNLYQSLFGKDWEVIKNIPKDTFSKIVGLQEQGIKIAKAPKELQAGLTALRGLEQKSFELSKMAGADVSEWRFTTENHFSRVWTGSQIVQEYTTKMVKGAFGKEKEIRVPVKIMAFTKDRVEGIQKLLQLHNENPDLKLELKPRSELYFRGTTPTSLSQKAYFKFINQIADLMGTTPEEAMQEVSMQGIARIIPRKTKIGQWQFRKGELGDYTTDPTKIYPSLWNKLTKKIYIDPEVRSSALRLNKIEDPSIRKSASDLIDAVAGKYQKQVLSYSITGKITGLQGQLKLGGRVNPPLVNMFQRLYGISVTGERNFLRATKNIFTKEGQKILDKIGVSTEVPLYEGMGRTRKVHWYNPLYLFGKSEGGKYVGNRNSVALSAYYKGLEMPFEKINANFKKLGLPQWKSAEDLAISFARSVVDATQFRYDVSDFAPLIRNNLGKVVFQFKTYGLNQIANTANVLKGKPLAGLELYYPEGLSKPQALHQAIVHFGVLFSQGGIKALGWGLEDALPAATLTWLAINAPALLYGITAFLGIDVSSSATVELSNMLSVLPWSDAQNVKKAIDAKNPELLLNISPAAVRIYRALDAMEHGMWLRDLESKQNIIKLKPLELAEFALGANPLAITQEQTIHYANVKRTKELNEMVSNAKRDIFIAIKNKDVELASNIVTNLKLQGIELKASDFAEYVERAELPRLLRDFQNARKSERKRIAEDIINLYK